MLSNVIATLLATVSSTQLILATIVVLCGGILFKSFAIDVSSKSSPPGPASWPVVGCFPTLLYLALVKKMDKTTIIKHLIKKYGDIVMVKLVFGRAMVILSGNDTIREAYKNPSLSDRPKTEVTEQVLGQTWLHFDSAKIQRRITMGALNGKYGFSKETLQDAVENECQSLMRAIRPLVGKTCDIKHIRVLVRNAKANLTLFLMTGKHFDVWNDDKVQNVLETIVEVVELTSSISASLTLIPKSIARLFPSPAYETWKECNHVIWSFVDDLIGKHAASPQNDTPSVIGAYHNDKQLSPENEKLFAGHGVNHLLRAGVDTTSLKFSRMIVLIAALPDIQDRVYEEIINVVGKTGSPRWSHRHLLHYSQATIMETMRRSRSIGSNVPHSAGRDTKLRGYNIPKGTTLLSLHELSVHCYASLGSDDDSKEIKPERFLNENGHFTERSDFFFGTGLRKCPGEQLARMSLLLFLTTILQKYKIQLGNGSPSPLEESLREDWEPWRQDIPYTLQLIPRDTK